MKSVIAPAPEPESKPEVLIVATVSEMKWTCTTIPVDLKSTAMVDAVLVNKHSITDCLTMTLTSTAAPTILSESPSTTAIEP